MSFTHWLATLTAYDPDAPGVTTLYYGMKGYRTESGDTPSETQFRPRILAVALPKRDMWGQGRTLGKVTQELGFLRLANGDGKLDAIMAYGFDARTALIASGKSGDPDAFDQWVFTQDQAETSTDAEGDTIQIGLRDVADELNVPFQQTYYAGSGGLEGGADLKGKPKPLLYGGPCRNIPAVLVYPEKSIYQVSANALNSIANVYDGGIALALGIASWEAKTSTFGTDSIQAAAYGNGTWIIVGENGQVDYSTDYGETWNAATISWPGSGTITGAHYANGIFMICGGDPTVASKTVATSSDGQSWTIRTTDSTVTLRAVTFSEALGIWVVAGGGGGSGVIQYSDDAGVSWTDVTPAGASGSLFTGVVFAKNKFVAVSGLYPSADEIVARSDDGVTWTTDTLNYDPSNLLALDDIVFQNGLFVVPTHPTPYVFTSPDGETWTISSTPFAESSGGLYEAVGGEGVLFVGGGGGKLGVSIDNGINWQAVSSGFSGDFIAAMAYGNGRFLIAGENGKVSLSQLTPGTYASQANLLDNDLAPDPGTFKTYAAGGYFRLGSPARGEVTCDATQGAAASNRTAAQIFVLALQQLGKTSGDWSASDVTAADSANNSVCGLWLGTDPIKGTEVLNRIAPSVGAWWGADMAGVYRFRILTDPSSGSSVASFTKDQANGVEGLRRLPLRGENAVPAFAVTVRYDRNYSVQRSGLGLGVDETLRGELAQEWRESTDTDTSVQTVHLRSPQIVVETLLVNSSDADTESDRLQTLHGADRTRYQFRAAANATNKALDLGDVVTLTYDRYDLASGKKLAIAGVQPQPEHEMILFEAWG